eukprot:MONOS_1640.1-p1 / transcript=MONOS_1640.1 / gene=MONOS_1640 / organism=Monocercomonoides_exilis_PA203 / gene_product=unspecified product / transcript_product=unspecified product / location=Mono_scaffold00030:60630-62559(-) / protein_length=621 / sequence_SO=supercontig / SO=protein_coding / is_pseudo=false
MISFLFILAAETTHFEKVLTNSRILHVILLAMSLLSLVLVTVYGFTDFLNEGLKSLQLYSFVFALIFGVIGFQLLYLFSTCTRYLFTWLLSLSPPPVRNEILCTISGALTITIIVIANEKFIYGLATEMIASYDEDSSRIWSTMKGGNRIGWHILLGSVFVLVESGFRTMWLNREWEIKQKRWLRWCAKNGKQEKGIQKRNYEMCEMDVNVGTKNPTESHGVKEENSRKAEKENLAKYDDETAMLLAESEEERKERLERVRKREEEKALKERKRLEAEKQQIAKKQQQLNELRKFMKEVEEKEKKEKIDRLTKSAQLTDEDFQSAMNDTSERLKLKNELSVAKLDEPQNQSSNQGISAKSSKSLLSTRNMLEEIESSSEEEEEKEGGFNMNDIVFDDSEDEVIEIDSTVSLDIGLVQNRQNALNKNKNATFAYGTTIRNENDEFSGQSKKRAKQTEGLNDVFFVMDKGFEETEHVENQHLVMKRDVLQKQFTSKKKKGVKKTVRQTSNKGSPSTSRNNHSSSSPSHSNGSLNEDGGRISASLEAQHIVEEEQRGINKSGTASIRSKSRGIKMKKEFEDDDIDDDDSIDEDSSDNMFVHHSRSSSMSSMSSVSSNTPLLFH